MLLGVQIAVTSIIMGHLNLGHEILVPGDLASFMEMVGFSFLHRIDYRIISSWTLAGWILRHYKNVICLKSSQILRNVLNCDNKINIRWEMKGSAKETMLGIWLSLHLRQWFHCCWRTQKKLTNWGCDATCTRYGSSMQGLTTRRDRSS